MQALGFFITLKRTLHRTEFFRRLEPLLLLDKFDAIQVSCHTIYQQLDYCVPNITIKKYNQTHYIKFWPDDNCKELETFI